MNQLITSREVQVAMADALWERHMELPIGVIVTVQTADPGAAVIFLTEKVARSWWRRALHAVGRAFMRWAHR